MTIVQMTAKYGKYNIGERVSIADHVAAQWCGEVNPRFQVAVRLPDEEAKGYFAAPAHKMVEMSDEAKADDEPRRGPGRPRRE